MPTKVERFIPPVQEDMIGKPLLADENDPSEKNLAYLALKKSGMLCTEFRRPNTEAIFTGLDLVANSDQQNDLMQKMKYGYFCGCCCVYNAAHLEMFVPAGHVGLLMNHKNEYLFAQPGMHNIESCFIRTCGEPVPLRGHIEHGNRTIAIVDQGYIGFATDNGQPILLPPGVHVWTSESMVYQSAALLKDHVVSLGPYTLVTVDEGYAAVTQNNGKQIILQGGSAYLLNHINWRFEKFISLKIQTDDLERIRATSADNINMMVTSTVNWRIVDAEVVAIMAAETMAMSGRAGDLNADIAELRKDVLKQALASLAGFIGTVNYADSFHMSAAVQSGKKKAGGRQKEQSFTDNPLYDTSKLESAVAHANALTSTYGVKIMSINIISASPCDQALTHTLASGAVASAEALQVETQARGNAKAVRISAEAEAQRKKIEFTGWARAKIINSKAGAESQTIQAEAAKNAEILQGEGEAERTRLHAGATADALMQIAAVVDTPGGSAAMVQHLAEQYVIQLPEMAKNTKMIIVPDKPNDVSGVVSTALSLTSGIGRV